MHSDMDWLRFVIFVLQDEFTIAFNDDFILTVLVETPLDNGTLALLFVIRVHRCVIFLGLLSTVLSLALL